MKRPFGQQSLRRVARRLGWKSASIKGSSAHLVKGAGFTDSANKGIRSESQSTPVIRLAPSLPLTCFLRACDCRDPSPDRQGGARGSAEVSGLALSLLRLPDGSRPQPLRATLSRSALAGSGCRNQASRATVSMRESAMPASDIHRAATGNGAAESKTHNPPRREPTRDRLCSRRRARLAPGAKLAMPVSGDTLLRMIHSAPLPDFVAPTVVGIDDWAWRRGQRYGTIICDLERNCVLDLLPDRNADSVASWLKRWPGIKVVPAIVRDSMLMAHAAARPTRCRWRTDGTCPTAWVRPCATRSAAIVTT